MLSGSDRASVKSRIHHIFTVGSTTRRLPPEKAARMGDKAKPLASQRLTALLCLSCA
jgi:hypothetical protein